MMNGLARRCLAALAWLAAVSALPAVANTEDPNQDAASLDKNFVVAEYYYNRALTMYRNGKIEEAHENFDKSLQAKPIAKTHRVRGALRMESGDMDGAMEDFASSIALEPDNPDHYVTRAVIRQLLGDFQGAIEDYTEVIEIEPEAARSWGNRGLARMKIGELESAEADLSRALEILPNYPEGFFNRGVIRHNRKDFAGAIEDYSEALKLKPGWNDVEINLSHAKKSLSALQARQ